MGHEPTTFFYRANLQKDRFEQTQHVLRQVQTESVCGKGGLEQNSTVQNVAGREQKRLEEK